MLPACLDESVDAVVDVLVRVGGGNLNADPGFALWYDGVGESDHVHSCRKKGEVSLSSGV